MGSCGCGCGCGVVVDLVGSIDLVGSVDFVGSVGPVGPVVIARPVDSAGQGDLFRAGGIVGNRAGNGVISADKAFRYGNGNKGVSVGAVTPGGAAAAAAAAADTAACGRLVGALDDYEEEVITRFFFRVALTTIVGGIWGATVGAGIGEP